MIPKLARHNNVRVSRLSNSAASTNHQLPLQDSALQKNGRNCDLKRNCFLRGVFSSINSCIDTLL